VGTGGSEGTRQTKLKNAKNKIKSGKSYFFYFDKSAERDSEMVMMTD
jgi:hypothetical protein